MEEFDKAVCKVVNKLEYLANFLYDDENVKEYFMEAYGYSEDDKAIFTVLEYIENWLLD